MKSRGDAQGCTESRTHVIRRNHSTESALIATADSIRRHGDQGGAAILVLLDLSTAFDTYLHRCWLRQAGLKDKALNLLV
ncbi:hypothetical protein NDU88_000463 [Pleurodeles waltl]|uniref:Reverse transcriptase domain-containing protein n=1 Tax=Pleurodeles waltl TaxID=8319 RepID=A0AAV7U418_PLEWA|nr:hypothetical protein NDU88_000463 [Pleurodeles waltl]